jgi:hypothetical protein
VAITPERAATPIAGRLLRASNTAVLTLRGAGDAPSSSALAVKSPPTDLKQVRSQGCWELVCRTGRGCQCRFRITSIGLY